MGSIACYACGTVNTACGWHVITPCRQCRTPLTPGARQPYWLPRGPEFPPWRHPAGLERLRVYATALLVSAPPDS